MRTAFYFLFLLIFAFACQPTNELAEKQDDKDSRTMHAQHFRFKKQNGKAVVELVHPDSKKVIAVLEPLQENKRVIALSGTFIGMIDRLGMVENIVAVSEIKYVYNPVLIQKFEEKSVFETGYEAQMKIEPMIASRPAMIFHSGYHVEFAHQKQFENLGIACVPIYDWREETPLGKAEWIKFYGFLFGELEKAETIYATIVENYSNLKEKAKDLPASDLVISGNVMGGEWCAPAGNSFMAQLMKDANITYNYFSTEGTGSVMKTQETILAENRDARYWINPGAKSLSELKTMNPKADLFTAFQNKQVYCYLNNDNYYWEVSSINPDRILSDYIQIAHPDFKRQDELFFYKQLK